MTTPSGFYVGQIGAKIILDTRDDTSLLAAATVLKINYCSPTGVKGSWVATREDTKLTYTTTAITDFAEAGTYQVQAYAEGPGWKIPGESVQMLVTAPIIPIV